MDQAPRLPYDGAAAAASRWRRALSQDRWAWALWGVFALVVVLAKLDAEPTFSNVFFLYRQAGIRWSAGRDLYANLTFPYLPPAVLLFLPFRHLSFELGGAIWRAVNIALFALGTWRLCRAAPGPGRASLFPLVTVLTVALSWSAARHGQITLAMAGPMMIACADLQRERWWRAGFFLALALAIKPLALVLLLTAVVIYRRVLGPTLLCLLGLLLLPFAFQDPAYVLQQYAALPGTLQESAARIDLERFAQGFRLLQTCGITVPGVVQVGIQAVLALGTLWVAREVRQRSGTHPAAVYLYAITAIYTLLMNPVSERNTYAMMAPVLGVFAAEAVLLPQRRTLLFVLVLVAMSFLSSSLAKASPNTPLAQLKPIMACVLAYYVVRRLLADQAGARI